MSELNITDLIHELGSSDENRRAAAVSALIKPDNHTHLKNLVYCLKDSKSQVSQKALEILKKCAIAESVPLLNELYNTDNKTAERVLSVAAHIKSPESYALMEKIILSTPSEKQKELIKKLSDDGINVLSVFSASPENARIFETVTRSTEYLDKIAEFFAHPDKNVRIYCLKQLARIPHSKTPSYIIPLIEDHDWEVRKTAVEILGNFTEERLIEILLKPLNDNNLKVKEAAKDALSSLARTYPEKFIELLKNNSRQFCRTIIKILGNTGSPALIPHLAARMGREEPETLELLKEAIQKNVDSYIASIDEIRSVRTDLPANVISMQQEIIIEPLKKIFETGDHEAAQFAASLLMKFDITGFHIVLQNFENPDIRSLAVSAFNTLKRSSRQNIVTSIFKSGNRENIKKVLDMLHSSDSREFIPLLIEHLDTPDAILKMKIINLLKKLGFENHYISILSEENPEMRLNAVKILSNFKTPEIAELLASHMKDTDKRIRLEIIAFLADFTSENFIKYFLQSLEDPVEEIQLAALTALGKIPGEKANTIIKSKLSSNIPAIREKATQIIGERSQLTFINSFDAMNEEQREKTGKALKKVSPALVKKLEEDLSSRDSEIRLKAVQILATIIDKNDTVITQLLIKALDDPEKKIRATIASALKKDGSDTAFKALIKLLNDPNERVRANVIEGLETCGKPREIIGMLLPFLRDPNNRIRANTVIALHNLGYVQVFDSLIEMMKSPDKWMRISAIYALGELKIEKIVSSLIKFLQDSDQDIRFNSARALIKIKNAEAVGALKKLLHDDNPKISNAVKNFFKKEIQ